MASKKQSAQEKLPVGISFGILRREGLSVARAVWKEVKEDNLSLVSAGVGFYALPAIFPAIGAIVSLYGLIADPQTIREHLGFVRSVLPRDAYQLLADQVRELTSGEDALSLWSASRAVIALLTAVNIAYEEAETRSFIAVNFMALLFTLAAVVVMLAARALLGGLPAAVDKLHHSGMAGVAYPFPPLAALGDAVLGDRLGRFFGLRLELRQIQRDLRVPRGRDHPAAVVLCVCLRGLRGRGN